MPHVVVKMVAGKTEEQKLRLAAEITRDVMSAFDLPEEAVSVAFEEYEKKDWTDKVYNPEILNKWETVYKKPGYKPS